MLSKKAALVAVLAAVAVVGLVVGLRRPALCLAARHWTQKLQSAPDEQIEPLLRQAAAWGEEGVPVLVEALGSGREPVARAGRRVIFSELERWKQLPVQERTSRLAVLAEALAARVENFGPTARSDAAELAAQILLWPLESETTSARDVIAHCDTILQAVHAPRHRMAGMVGPGMREATGGQMPPAPASELPGRETSGAMAPRATRFPGAAPDALRDQTVAEMARLPGGGLPIDWFPRPPSETPGALSEGRGPEDEPGLLDRPSNARRLSPRGTRSAADPCCPEPADQTPRAQGPASPDRAQTSVLNGEMRLEPDVMSRGMASRQALSAAASSAAGQPDSLARLDALEVMGRIRSADPSAADAAREELVRRGFGPRELELARRLTDPRPEVRRELAQILPGLAGVDAVAWLMWLSRDQDADVRLAAVTVMATTGDPALLRELEKIALKDSDPRVRAAAERLAERRRTELRRAELR